MQREVTKRALASHKAVADVAEVGVTSEPTSIIPQKDADTNRSTEILFETNLLSEHNLGCRCDK